MDLLCDCELKRFYIVSGDACGVFGIIVAEMLAIVGLSGKWMTTPDCFKIMEKMATHFGKKQIWCVTQDMRLANLLIRRGFVETPIGLVYSVKE